MKNLEIIKEPNGELLCSSTLVTVGHWFKVDEVNYYALDDKAIKYTKKLLRI